MIRSTRWLSLPMIMLLAGPAALAQNNASNYLNPYATDVRKAIAPQPGEAPRPGLNQGNGESAACRELRMRMDRARSMPHAESRPFYSDSPRRNGQASAGPVGSVASDPLADAEQRYRNECN
ncbi:hypothetical protein [Herbaspirillum sp. YR522]|uniref:hypothetical protein n=1 Tax=Herbaspirillum sp. YR522 TaxID=1144342 RepID=UPI00026FBC6E|nr:hypothetical protein [Herbaspirillum sp. YR522]EJN00288.1 hypothetical protein PMI40_03622 [Herbaspirillum sp. YR522]